MSAAGRLNTGLLAYMYGINSVLERRDPDIRLLRLAYRTRRNRAAEKVNRL